MRVALLQLDLSWENPAENHLRAERRLQEAAALGARLAILPEMFPTGFSMNGERVAEPPDGPSARFLQATAEGLGMWILAGVAERDPQGGLPRNNALLVAPTGEIQRYCKQHPFSFAGEHERYAPGNTEATWTVDGVRITPFICYDLRFPEPFRRTTDATDLYVVVANWPDRRRLHWRTLLQARAIENLAYVAGVNRVGDGGGLHYAGDSALFSPWGEALVTAAEVETVLLAEVDPSMVQGVRESFPVLRDRK